MIVVAPLIDVQFVQIGSSHQGIHIVFGWPEPKSGRFFHHGNWGGPRPPRELMEKYNSPTADKVMEMQQKARPWDSPGGPRQLWWWLDFCVADHGDTIDDYGGTIDHLEN